MNPSAVVSAIRVALPDRILDNHELAALFPGWSAEKIYAKTGIRERRIAGEDEFASDLAVRAATQLIDDLQVDRAGIDFLLHCSQSQDYVMPNTACLLQDRLGLPTTCAAMDMTLGCSGYIYGLGLAKGLVESGQARTLIFTTADTHSKTLHPGDKSVRTLFGDGATATLIRAGDSPTLTGPFVYGTDGAGADFLILPTGGMRNRYEKDAPLIEDESGNVRTLNHFQLKGPDVFRFTLDVVPDAVDRLLQQADLPMEAVDHFVFHQANQFMLDHLRRKLKIPAEKFHLALEDVGNTVSSSIPIALKRANDEGRLKPGQLLMLVGFGIGLSWGATLLRWPEIAPA